MSLYEQAKAALRKGADPDQLAAVMGISPLTVRRVKEMILREAADSCFDADVEEFPVYESRQDADECEAVTTLRNRDGKPTLPTHEP